MPNKTSRRKRKEPSLAEQIVALCDEMLRLGREPGGEYKYGALRRGVMRGAQWETLAVELDGVAQRIANLVKSLVPAYDTTTFYNPAPVSVHKAYPQARKELSEEGRFWLQEDWLRGEGAEAVQDADDLLNQDRADMDPEAFDLPDDEPAEPDLYAIQEVRTRMQRTKMQWPGYVVELCLTRSGLRPYRLFYSPPAFLHAFDERFNALKTWAAERARQAGDGKTRGGKADAEDLQPTSCLTSLQVIGSGQVYDGWEALRAILAVATRKVDIEDAHINADVVALLGGAPDCVVVRVLTKKLYEDADPAFRRLQQQRSGSLEVRTTASLHPRRVYVDDRAYILEDSIKDLACKTASSIVPVGKPTETRRLMEDFERRWATAGVRIRPKA